MNLFFVFLIFLGLILVVYIYHKVNYIWIEKLAFLLVLSLPFERIPSIEIGFGTLKINHLLILFSLFIFIILLIKKKLSKDISKLNLASFWVFIFLILSIFSWLKVIEISRFLNTQIATILVFFGFLLLSNFLKNIYKTLIYLRIILLLIVIFSIYQWVGDFIDLSNSLTGLSRTYSKEISGFPRSIGTAVEPQYLAQMYYLPFFLSLFSLIFKSEFSDKNILKSNFRFNLNFIFKKQFFLILKNKYLKDLERIKNNNLFSVYKTHNINNFFSFRNINNIFYLTLFFLGILLTNSKGAFVIIGFSLFLIFFLLVKIGKEKILKLVLYFSLIFVFIFSFIMSINPKINDYYIKNKTSIIATIKGDTASSAERELFLDSAIYILKDNYLWGIGSGQYGVYANNLVKRDINIQEDNYLIVNNVYIEVWLEHGIFSFLVFLLGLLYPLIMIIFLLLKNYSKTILNNPKWIVEALTLFFTLLASYIQWLWFSPIYIMPIFIILGISYKFVYESLKSHNVS